MERHLVVGTAGHVDHGKTELVKALTGVDTDRWEEEKRRGITIDLGFAPLELGENLSASFVDVPGHEDFVRNMVAGATGIDIVLLVVAADEGVMPQTEEHLRIIEFLGVRHGVIALSKTDLADPEWVDLVREDLREKLEGSPVRWHGTVAVAAPSGEGITEVRTALSEAAQSVDRSADQDLYRLPVDRAFSVAGAGTVVTGTTWSGEVAVGSDLWVLPARQKGRLRSVEVHGKPVEKAIPGRRTALALSGVSREQVPRGSVIVGHPDWEPTRVIDALVTLLPSAQPITQRTRIRVHLGTAEVMARCTPQASAVEPATTGAVRLRLEEPVVARWGDRGVIRWYSPVTTVGGFLVVDPYPEPRPRRPRWTNEKNSDDVWVRLRAMARGRGSRGLSIESVSVRAGVAPQAVAGIEAHAEEHDLVGSQGLLFSVETVTDHEREALTSVGGFHRENPLEPGLPLADLRTGLGSGKLADLVIDRLQGRGELVAEGSVVRLPEFEARLEEEQAGTAQQMIGLLRDAGAEGLLTGDLVQKLRSEEAGALAEYLVRRGDAVRLGKDRYYDRRELDRLALMVVEHLDREGSATPADLRDVVGLSRKFLIPVLEWLDGQGFTVREGDSRILGPAGAKLLENRG